jgi:hypothetical protein
MDLERFSPVASVLDIEPETVFHLLCLGLFMEETDHAGQVPGATLQVGFADLSKLRGDKRDHDPEYRDDDCELDEGKAIRSRIA